MADALDAVSPDVAARTKALLSAVASGGTQGLRAYEQGETALRQSKTDAITRAQQRAGLIGGPEAQGFEAGTARMFDRGIGNMANSRTTFEANMANLGSAHKNYLDQVAAAVPLVRADTERKLALKRAELENAAIEEARKEAAKAAKENKPKLSEILGLTENIGSLYAPDADPLRGTVGERLQPNGLFPKIVSGQTTQGSASLNPNRNWVTDDMMMTAADNAAFNGTTTEFELAKIVAEVSGLDPAETASMITPSNVAAASTKADKATAPAQTDTAAKALAQKYDTKGVTYDLARSVLNNTDFQEDVAWILSGADGKSREEVEKILRDYYVTDRGWNAEYNILVGEYLSRLPRKK